MTALNPDHPAATPAVDPPAQDAEIYALLAEFEDVDSIMHAAEATRDAGFKKFDVHSPFPVHGIDKKIGIKPTILPWIVLLAGLTGLCSGASLTIYTMATYFQFPFLPDNLRGYQYMVSGKPYDSFPAWIPVMFELTILFSAFTSGLGMLVLNKLPMLYHPLHRSRRFKRVTQDRFFLVIEARDRKFELAKTTQHMRDLGATAIEVVEE